MNIIGKPRRRVDARAKVTGQTKFADDLMLPRMSGFEVLSHLRAEAPPGNAHILVMSAWPNSEASSRAAGGDSFLPKPFNPDDLMAIVTEVVGAPVT